MASKTRTPMSGLFVTLSNVFCFHDKEYLCSFPCPPSNHLSPLSKVLAHSTRKKNNILKKPTPQPLNKEKHIQNSLSRARQHLGHFTRRDGGISNHPHQLFQPCALPFPTFPPLRQLRTGKPLSHYFIYVGTRTYWTRAINILLKC